MATPTRPHRQRPAESLTSNAKQRMCPSCTVRYAMGPPTREFPSEMRMDPVTVQNLEAAARDFDEIADEAPDEHFTAVDFLDWIKPDLTYRRNEVHGRGQSFGK